MKSKLVYILSALAVVALCAISCSPEAPWSTENVEIKMEVKTVSAGFVECSFATNKDAYYLINIEPAREGEDPMKRQKQFMMLVLDSVNLEYLTWRNDLLKEGEINIAPFSSYALQYGEVDHFFTGLLPNMDYWVYAFVVNPDKLKPEGKLYFTTVTTTEESIVDIHFDYRIKGTWDYIYPRDSMGHINAHFPYISTTRDSVELAQDTLGLSPQLYFKWWMLYQFLVPESARVLFGVSAFENDGISTHLAFEEGHTYYTAIGGFDGSFKQATLYKFTWMGDSTNLYFTEEQNIANSNEW